MYKKSVEGVEHEIECQSLLAAFEFETFCYSMETAAEVLNTEVLFTCKRN